MTDIVERLRAAGLRDGFAVILHQHVIQAADEIERLRDALELLLKKFGNCARLHGNDEEFIAEATKFARDALGENDRLRQQVDDMNERTK